MTSGSSSGLGALVIWRQRASFWRRSVFRSLRAVPSSLRRWSRRVRRSSTLTRPSLCLSAWSCVIELLGLDALLVDLGAEPVAGLGRRLGAQVQALHDVEVGEGVRGGGRELGAAARDGHGHQAAVADGADAEPPKEGVDHRLHLTALARGLGEDGLDLGLVPRPSVLGVVQQVELVHHAPGEAAALKQLVLRLVVVVTLRVELRDLLEVEDARVGALDEDLRGAFVAPAGSGACGGWQGRTRP